MNYVRLYMPSVVPDERKNPRKFAKIDERIVQLRGVILSHSRSVFYQILSSIGYDVFAQKAERFFEEDWTDLGLMLGKIELQNLLEEIGDKRIQTLLTASRGRARSVLLTCLSKAQRDRISPAFHSTMLYGTRNLLNGGLLPRLAGEIESDEMQSHIQASIADIQSTTDTLLNKMRLKQKLGKGHGYSRLMESRLLRRSVLPKKINRGTVLHDRYVLRRILDAKEDKQRGNHQTTPAVSGEVFPAPTNMHSQSLKGGIDGMTYGDWQIPGEIDGQLESRMDLVEELNWA